MNELSNDARECLIAGLAGLGPDDAARARVRSAVLVRVGVAAAAGATVTAGTATATAAAGAKLGSGVLVKLLLSVAIAGGVGTAGYVAATQPEPPAATPELAASSDDAPRAARRDTPVELEAVAAEPAVAVEPAAASDHPAPRTAPRAVERESAPARETTMPEQLALLRTATRALAAGDAAAALATVHRYSERFAEGALRPELTVIEIDALCALERDDDAARRAAAFLEQWPASPLAERVRASCAGGADR